MKTIAAPEIKCKKSTCISGDKGCYYHSWAGPNADALFECRLFGVFLKDTETGEQIRCNYCLDYEKTGRLPDMI